jgi:hypothetical protein
MEGERQSSSVVRLSAEEAGRAFGDTSDSSGNINGESQTARPVHTTIHCTKAIRDLWPNPLARQWRQQYPDVFDADDLRLAVNQPRYHFCEWFAAIHFFHRDGAHSLVEKYAFQNHPAKVAQLAALLSEPQRDTLAEIGKKYKIQPPDLLVFIPGTRYWFAEVKGPRDDLSAKQIQSHGAITRELGVPVEIIEVKIMTYRKNASTPKVKKLRTSACAVAAIATVTAVRR